MIRICQTRVSSFRHILNTINCKATHSQVDTHLSFSKMVHRGVYLYSKKTDKQPKKSGAPAVKPKDRSEYIPGSQSFKKGIKEVQSMQTVSQQNVEQASLKKIIADQRASLAQSLKEQHQLALQSEQSETKKKKIFSNQKVENQDQKYFLLRPLKYLSSTYTNLFALNLLGYAALEIMQKHNYVGWMFGLMTQPAALTAVAVLMGYNLAFWIVRQSFCMHIPTAQLTNTKLSIVSSSYRNLAELIWIAVQFGALFYAIFFPIPIAPYQAYALLGFTSFASLGINLRQVCKSTNSTFRSYVKSYVKVLSTASLLIFLHAVYEIQLKAADTPQNTFDSQSYRKRILQMKEGYEQFRNSLKQKNFVMKEDQKINAFDQE